MECDSKDAQRVVITNQDKAPVLVKFSSGEVYEAAAAQLDPKTGVYIPTTSAQCVDSASGALTLQYTHGDKCVHRRFPEDRWTTAQMGNESAFYYTVPSWNFGDKAEICEDAANNNSNANADDNNNVNVDEEGPRGNSNGAWWHWFWPRECMRVNQSNPWEFWLVLLMVALLLFLAVYFWRSSSITSMFSSSTPCTTCPAAAELQQLLKRKV